MESHFKFDITQRARSVSQRAQRILAFSALIITIFAVNTVYAQTFPLQVQVSVMPPYSAYLQDYPGVGQQVRVFIINTSRSTYQIRLTGQLTGDNGIEIKTSPNYRPPRPVTVPPGQTLLTRNDLEGLFDLNQIEVTGIDKNLLARGLPLPDGTYQLCIRAYNETATNTAATAFGQALSAEFPLGCSAPIVVRSVEPPILISPLCDANVTATTPQAVVFTWTPPVGVSPASVEYTLRVVELPQENIDPNVFIDAITLPKSGVELRNLRTSTFLYGPTQPPLVVGKRYAWRVQAIDRSSKLHFQNDGKSPVCAFTYGNESTPKLPILPIASTDSTKEKKYVVKSGELPINCSCKIELGDKTVDNSGVLKSRSATIAGFQLTFLDNVNESEGGVLNGDGMIPLPLVNSQYARLRVHLYNVQCNTAGQVIGGVVRARYSDKADPSLKPNWDKPDYTPPTLTSDQIGNISKTLADNKDMLVSSLKNSANSVGFDVPFGIDKSFGPITTNIAITDVTFTPEQAYYQANTWIVLNSKPGGFSGIPLSGYNLCMSADKPFCGEGMLYLGQDMELSKFLSLKGGPALPMMKAEELAAKYTYVYFDVEGFKKMGIRAGLKPPGLHRVADGADLEMLASSDVNTPDFDDWNAELTFDDFYVGSLKDYVFSMTDADGKVNKGFYDHSDTKNPDGFVDGYTDMGNLWQGIYFPLVQLKLSGPFAKLNKKGKPLTGGVKSLIYDSQNGFSGKVFLQSVLTLGDGQLKSWGISIDEISGTFKKSEFQEASMRGGIGLPLFKKDDGTASTLSYTAAIVNNPNSTDITFNVQPTDNMHVDVWRADLQLNSDSHINLAYITGSFSASAIFNGKLSLDLSIAKVTAAEFTGLGVMTEAPYFTMKNVSFNSPQRYIGAPGDDGFPLTLTNFAVQEAPGAKVSAPAIAKDLAFTGNVNLTESANFSASATARMRFTVGPSWESWGYNDYFIDSLSAAGTIGPASVSATIGFMHDDPTWGNGFFGHALLDVGLAGSVGVQARFGRTIGDKGFKYYYVSGVVPLGPTGIPLGSTGLAMKAFRGGLYRGIDQKIAGTNVSYSPSSTVELGIQVGVIIGTVGTNMLNMDGTLTFQFGADPKVTIDAAAYVLHNGSPPNYENPLASGHALLKVDINNGTISGSASLTARQGLSEGLSLAAEANAEIYFEPRNLNFYLAFGNPNGQRIDLSLMLGSKEIIGLDSYFLMGTYIPQSVFGTLPPPMSTDIVSPELISRLNYKPNPFKGNGKGVAFGAGFHIGTPKDQVQVNFGPFYFSYYLGAGYDFVLQEVQACKGYNPPGFNGWYAVGQVYAGLGFSLGVDVDLWFFSGKVEVAGGDAAALLQGGMVNPVWLQGSVAIRYRALRGLVKGTCSAHVEYNTDKICIPDPPPVNPFAQPLISSLQPNGEKDLNIISPFYAEFNYPIETNIDVDSVDINGNYRATITFRVAYIPGQQFVAQPVGSVSAKYASCVGDNSGRLRYGKNEEGESNTTATFYRNAAMAPEIDHTLTLGLVATRRQADGKFHPFYFKGKLVDTTAVAKFTTDKCNPSMTREGNNKTVAYSYPFEGQRYFMKGEVNTGFVEFLAKSCCIEGLTNNEDFSLKVRISPGFDGVFDDKKALFADPTYDGLHVKYTMPAGLVNSQLYKLELVRIPTQTYIDKQEAVLAELKKKAKQQASAGNLYASVSQVAHSGPKLSAPGSGLSSQQAPLPAGMNNKGNNSPGSTPGGGKQYTAPLGSTGNYAPGAGAGPLAMSVNTKADQIGTQYGNKLPLVDDGGLVLYDPNKSKKSDKLVKTSKAQQDYEIGKQLEQVLYSYYFQTSRFNTLAEKIQASGFNIADQKNTTKVLGLSLPDAVFTTPMSNSLENFEQYELQVADLGYTKYLPPLVNFRANTTINPWFDTYMKPTIRLMYPASYALDRAKKQQQNQSSGGGLFSGVVDQVSDAVSGAVSGMFGDNIDASVDADIELLERQMTWVTAQFDLPEKPIQSWEVDGALHGSEGYYKTDQITGEEVKVASGTAASIHKNGTQRYGICLSALPFQDMYLQRLVPFVDQYLNINREDFQVKGFLLDAAILGTALVVADEYNLSQLWKDNFSKNCKPALAKLDTKLPIIELNEAINKIISDAQNYANASTPFTNTSYQQMSGDQGYSNAVNGTTPPPQKNTFATHGFYVQATIRSHFAYIDAYDAISKIFWNDATTKALKAVKEGKYKALASQHGSLGQFDVWAFSPLKMAEMSLSNSAGISDILYDAAHKCPSKKAYENMSKTKRSGIIYIK
ncbi:hypothetical protein [Spirosoma aerolatum]|uniref:hypothetical protein n=1 Tax=Spirosoma aerolatum TaxID=1211326 RepID=UPI0009AC4E00|nr:hypothetical protein [Spirosoma aerolatum]